MGNNWHPWDPYWNLGEACAQQRTWCGWTYQNLQHILKSLSKLQRVSSHCVLQFQVRVTIHQTQRTERSIKSVPICAPGDCCGKMSLFTFWRIFLVTFGFAGYLHLYNKFLLTPKAAR